MESSAIKSTPQLEQEDDDDDDAWDNDDFVIPSFDLEKAEEDKTDPPEVEILKPSLQEATREEKVYVNPHASHSETKKKRLKQKLKEADRKSSNAGGRENKVEHLRELVGGGNGNGVAGATTKGSTRDWLDSHCHESEFDKE